MHPPRIIMLETGFQLALDWEFELEHLSTLPVSVKRHGHPLINPLDGLHWMTYQLDEGEIGFTRNTHEHLPSVTNYVADWLIGRFPGLPVVREHIHFVRTRGSIRMHRDESGRRTAINIGIKNCQVAKTRTSNDDIEEHWDVAHTDYTCQEKGVYLVNTAVLHSVECHPDHLKDERLLITMSMPETFREVCTTLLLGYAHNGSEKTP